MTRQIAFLAFGALGGAILTWLLVSADGEPVTQPAIPEPVRDIVNVPKVSIARAEEHRAEQYAGLATIEEISALPTAFGRAEALYILAGRSDSAEVQRLLFDANRIADEQDRSASIGILFFRLAELDPDSALALARTAEFSGDRRHEARVWVSWGRRDLDGALFAAKTRTSERQRKGAAQNLYSAYGYMGNEITDRIEQELDAPPDRTTRTKFLHQLADRSPAEAIAFINGMEAGALQDEFVYGLARYLAQEDPTFAAGFGELFENEMFRAMFKRTVAMNAASENPRETLDRILAEGSIGRHRNQARSAISALANKDLDAALHYFSQIRSEDERRNLGWSIAEQYAKKDPAAAMAWARENDKGERWGMLMQVLVQIAATDPQLALDEAQKISNNSQRNNLLQNLFSQTVQLNPERATAMLDSIENSKDKRAVASGMIGSWMRTDLDAAVNWVLQQDDELVTQLMPHVSGMLPRMDLEAAIRMIPRLEGDQSRQLRTEIAQRIAINRSAADAQAFIQQYEGQDGYSQLQTAVINGVARSDPYLAKQMAGQLASEAERDQAYAEVVRQHARQSPQEAASWLTSIRSDNQRGAAARAVAQQWYGNDSLSALRWVESLPVGLARDSAIMGMARHFGELTQQQQRLLDSIEDESMRGQAQLQTIRQLMRSNPAEARKRLAEIDIPNYQRQQYEEYIRRAGG
ncbi:MAG: hypothetical protein ACE5F8_00970 [Woeseiaceae bacterium]